MLPSNLLDRLPAKESPITYLLSHLTSEERQQFLSSLNPVEAAIVEHSWSFWARNEQRPPQSFVDKEKHTWFIKAGRGFGKTRVGSEEVIKQAEDLGRHYRNPTMALIAKDPSDARKVMLEGESGILRVSPPWFRPHWEPSKTQVTWPNGTVANIFSTEVPDDLRGPNHYFGWWDEPAKAKHPQETWDMYQMGLRLGRDPQSLLTGTPRPIKVIKDILKDKDTVVTGGSTFDNASNLAPSFLQYITRKYQGTRLGRQELAAELLDETEGALWSLKQIDDLRVDHPPKMKRVVVGVDPQGANPHDRKPGEEDENAETGIICAGVDEGSNDVYVLADRSGDYSPDEWGTIAIETAWEFGAEEVIGEVNNGGSMVEFVVRTAAENLRVQRGKRVSHKFKSVSASRGKYTRAEPVSQLYEQGRAHHVGAFPELEDQMSTWVPGMKSPDRMDALVWAVTGLVFTEHKEPLKSVTW